MLLTTAASPAELLLPPSGQQVPHGGSSRSSAAASGWKPFLSTVPELQEQAPANSARILAAAATFVQKLQLLAAVSPAAAAAGLSLDELHVTLSSKRRLRQAAAAAAKASTTVGGSAAGRVDDAQQGQQQPAAEHPGAAADHVGGAGTDGNDRMGPQLERELQAFLSRALSEVKAIEDGARAQATGISQSFPLARRSVVAALAACALLLDATAAGAAHRTPQPPVAAGAWAAELDAQVQQLLGQLYSLHRNGAVHKQGVDHLHVSKSGGTSFTELSEFNGCACTSRSDNGLLPAPWDDRPRWLDGEAAKRALGLDRSGKPSVMDGWSDSGPRQPQSYGGGDVSRATAAGYCRARTNALSARFLQFATNEYTLYGGQDSPRDTFICPELLNTIVVREPRARMVSHMHYMLPHFVSLLAGSDAAFRRGGAVSRAADWDRIAPFPFDNYLTRSLLGEAVFRSPVGRLGDAARFWADVGSSSPAANTTSSSIVAAALRRLKVDEAANAKLATAARLVLQQFDVVMALEDGEANRPHIQRALGWPYPLDLVRKRVSAENLETNVQVELAELLPDDMAELRARHTKLDDVTYRYGQLFSKLDLVVWDTAAQLEAQACPGNTGSERGSALVAQAANQQAITAHVAAAEAAASVAGGDASSGQQQQQQQPQQQHHHHYRSAAEVARGQQALRARRSRGAAAAAASRKLLMSSAARDVMRYAQRVAAEALHSSMGGQLTSRLTGLQDWNVTRAVLEGQGQAQVGDGRVCSEVAAAAWGSVTGTCGWVGISRWAVTLQAQGRLK
ncbi:hypothetical protein HYH02_006316 [Chlamydomonas schloesseri]|uniref:Sulfotransferase n=1 Tax=Chlamydomonas schloesseri TaxID=2026947 RepID=A0A835WIR9_9CHLO|nr:hypothetical protein HYH02_006316 [Chlamydomonas schloesseri]|eukprot:KAG2448424.1 hypothetical protein HYH02_006316 [Chlamydomonas schloesseri]